MISAFVEQWEQHWWMSQAEQVREFAVMILSMFVVVVVVPALPGTLLRLLRRVRRKR